MVQDIAVSDGMRIIWDIGITMDDGVVLHADVFLPQAEGRYPAILNHGPYSKGLAFQEGYKSRWDSMVAAYPEILSGTTANYENWEVVDPEKWCSDGYACIRIDSVAQAARPASSRTGRRARPGTCTIASNGLRRRIGATARSE